MTAQQLIAMLQKLPPKTQVFGWIDGGTISPHEVNELDFCPESNTVLIDFINTHEYAS